MSNPDHPDGQVSLTMISIKLPTFWKDSPEVCFLQAKSQFANKRVTAFLTISRILHYSNVYPEQSIPVLADQRPSELMDKMLVLLLEDEKPDFFFKVLLMDHLSADICSHLMTKLISNPR